jgi:hypothetical protein
LSIHKSLLNDAYLNSPQYSPVLYGNHFVNFHYIDKKPSDTYDQTFEQCGGVMNTDSVGSLPRNKEQIYNIVSSGKPNTHDPLFAIIEICKKEESQVDPFIRNVQGAPDAMCVLAKQHQLNDLVRFCCNPSSFQYLVWIRPLTSENLA